jgi:hypothetical protein
MAIIGGLNLGGSIEPVYNTAGLAEIAMVENESICSTLFA